MILYTRYVHDFFFVFDHITLISFIKIENMDIIHFVELVNFYNRAEENNERVPKRFIRDMQNPIDFYDDKEFFNRFR